MLCQDILIVAIYTKGMKDTGCIIITTITITTMVAHTTTIIIIMAVSTTTTMSSTVIVATTSWHVPPLAGPPHLTSTSDFF
ncbi:hypothetical protein [Helicobacter salomonis]|uniref:hypothetical protein n=1 Tax=Helicobacter salomonis TaxID=56878 RepID=UPI001315571B|nr:hypothetical protein [Helicobacter salomonis]